MFEKVVCEAWGDVKRACVYVLTNQRTGRMYVGSTADLKNRLRTHWTGRKRDRSSFGYKEFLNDRDNGDRFSCLVLYDYKGDLKGGSRGAYSPLNVHLSKVETDYILALKESHSLYNAKLKDGKYVNGETIQRGKRKLIA